MKKIGIVGGIGPESTVDYYKMIIGAFHERQAVMGYPEILIYSIDLTALTRWVEAGELERLADWLLEKVVALHRAGAEFAVIASNTPHVVFDAIQSRSPLPMLSIVKETCKTAQQRGLKRLGLLGTRFTMESDFYNKAFADKQMTLFVPDREERELIHHRLFSEIELGIFKDSTRQELLSIVKKLIERYSIDAVILGCTELPLILTQDEFDIPFLNTTAIHAESIVKFCL